MTHKPENKVDQTVLGDFLKFAKEIEEESHAHIDEPASLDDVHQDTKSKTYGDYVINKVQSGESVHETVREVVFDSIKSVYPSTHKIEHSQSVDMASVIDEKRKELYEILENLDESLADKSVEDVAATFSSLLDIQSQLCMQRTDGVISIRTRLFQFFPPKTKKETIPAALRQEIGLIFSPEEVQAIRSKVADLDDEDTLKPFFTTILDQAYDAVQYNEMSGYLLIEMTHFFMHKLRINGYSDSPKYIEFQDRFQRVKESFDRAIEELRDAEKSITHHLANRPVLLELPKLLRLLIQIKLGLLDPKNTRQIVEHIQNRLGDYARARNAVAFDFNRLPSFQHGVRLRQSIILNLQKDILDYMGHVFADEFETIKDEFKQIIDEIETASATLQTDSPEYKAMLQRKVRLQSKLDEQQRKLNIIHSQEKLVNVQYNLISQSIKRYQQEDALLKKADEIQPGSKVDEKLKQTTTQPAFNPNSRMVRTQKRR